MSKKEKILSDKHTLVLHDFIPYRINVLADKISRSLATIYEHDFGLSIYEWRVLATLASQGSISATELAKKTNLDKVRLSRTSANLYNDKLILRRVSSGDRRKTFFRISKKGIRVYEEIVPLALEWQESLLSSFSESEVCKLSGMLSELELRFLDEKLKGGQ